MKWACIQILRPNNNKMELMLLNQNESRCYRLRKKSKQSKFSTSYSSTWTSVVIHSCLTLLRLYKPEIERFDEPFTIRQTEEVSSPTSRSYGGFIRNLFSSTNTGNTSGSLTGTATTASLPITAAQGERLTDSEFRGSKGNQLMNIISNILSCKRHFI